MIPRIFEEDVKRELDRLEIQGKPHLVPLDSAPFRGPGTSAGAEDQEKRVVGFALRVNGLTAEESIRLQEEGLGGRRRMGCRASAHFL